ncbi:MAG: hypothetical protein HKN00_09180 [Flavobacteriaceae bacterium]|nr:hypothetical protein [Bacteroidia bacterium]MBT8288754.1 hypothetical protein [Bacteroidia bacterium]NNF75343.1 hypothetical protein [Flavobacteriaceae bacterium]NNK73216.1 hypothetical protein [Flavobacteriaceae bacterium]
MTSLLALHAVFLIQQIDIITILTITLAVFLVLLILGILKSAKLKAENEKLSKPKSSSDEDNKIYRDFREGHLYDNF